MLSLHLPHLVSDISRRDAVLWIQGDPTDATNDAPLADLIRLPWQFVLSESIGPKLKARLGTNEGYADPLVRKRGFVQLVSDRPSKIELPQRCLPIYLLEPPSTGQTTMEEQLRRLETLALLASSNIRRLVVLSLVDHPIPVDLDQVWAAGFRSNISFVSASQDAEQATIQWADKNAGDGRSVVSLHVGDATAFAREVLEEYTKYHPDAKTVIRLRDTLGKTVSLDISQVDNPELPLLDQCSIVQERDLLPLVPEDLSSEELDNFFSDPSASWRPYAAGLVWERRVSGDHDFHDLLRRLEERGADENFIAHVACEPGAGGTTFIRALAWRLAHHGYPVLVAPQSPDIPDALQVANFMTRVYDEAKASRQPTTADAAGAVTRRYEVPWIVVLDRVHWQHRELDLRRFLTELRSRARPACILVVSGPQRGVSFLNSEYKMVGHLSHAISEEDALRLGRHLNRFLNQFGNDRTEAQWRDFYRRHTADDIGGIAAFWIVLSFWLRRQLDLSDTLQSMLYGVFRESISRTDLQRAILYIAAMSVERLPIPYQILPKSEDDWPIHHHLEDERPNLGALGVIRLSGRDREGWVLAHDVVGRLLLNAVYHDRDVLVSLGYGNANDPTQLRLMVLSEISSRSELGLVEYRGLADNFATSIFKVDPDHGRGEFVNWWREVLSALDEMPSALRRSSRVFLHHTSVSRRRIAKFDARLIDTTPEDRQALLERAVHDISYALHNIQYQSGSEPDLNLLNSLAHAYMDLAEVERQRGASESYIAQLREKAQQAAFQAYETSPTSSFAIETFVRNLLTDTAPGKPATIENCTRALGILFATITSNQETYRHGKLDSLAGQAVRMLMRQKPSTNAMKAPKGPLALLVNAWVTLCFGMDLDEFSLEDVPNENRVNAIDVLEDHSGRGNAQVTRLLYELVSLSFPHDFRRQLQCLEQLQGIHGSGSPQERLEYAVLLYQCGRASDGEKIFYELRRVWKQSEHFVQVPSHLRWLRNELGEHAVVQAAAMGDLGGRPMARVRELRNARAPYRPEEFDARVMSAGQRFACLVSFGRNGPFLRPVTARIP